MLQSWPKSFGHKNNNNNNNNNNSGNSLFHSVWNFPAGRVFPPYLFYLLLMTVLWGMCFRQTLWFWTHRGDKSPQGVVDLRQNPNVLSSSQSSVIGIREPQKVGDRKIIKGCRVSLSSFLDGATEDKRSKVTGSNLQGQLQTKRESGPRWTDSPSTVFLFIC